MARLTLVQRGVQLSFACLTALVVVTTASFAAAQSDVPGAAPPKPQPAFETATAPGPVAAPVLAVKTRFHLSRKGGVTILSSLAPVVASLQGPGAPLTIRIDETIAPLLTVIERGDRPPLAHLRVQQAVIERPDVKFVVENIEADASLGEDNIAIDAVSMRVRPLDLPYWSPPLDLAGRAAFNAGTLAFGGTATSAVGRVVATAEGVAATREASGRAQFELRPIAFVPGGLQPHELVPAIGDFLVAMRGTVAARGTLRWSQGEPAMSGSLLLSDLSFAAGGVGVENLTSTMTFDRVWPPRTPPGQALTVGRIDPGLPVTDGTVRFQLDDRGRLRIEHAAIAFSGGRLSIEPVTLDPEADHHDLVFRAENLDLQDVLDAANVEAARATGSVSGRIPVSVSRRGVAVKHATLAADAEGVLRYQPEVAPDALQQEDGGIELLRDALKNFRYDRLTITLDGGTSQEWQSTVHLAGNNPDVLEGHPFVLNVNLRVVPGEALVQLGAQNVSVGDTFPLYNALFGLNFLEWLGNRLAAMDAVMADPDK